MLSLAVILGLISILFGYMYYSQTFSKAAQMINKFPGPKIVPVFGNLLYLRSSPPIMFKRLRHLASVYRRSYRVWNTMYGVISIISAEDAEILLTSTKHIKKSRIYDFLYEWLGTGLLTSSGKKWQHRRKLLTPSFHFNILRKFTKTFGEHAQILVEDLQKECSKPQTSISPYISQTTLQAICETAMGTSIDLKDEKQKNYFQSIYKMAPLVVNRIMSPWLYNNFIFNLTPFGWKYNKLTKYLHTFTSSVIKEREENFKDSDLEILDNVEDDIVEKKRLAMLDLLISAKKKTGSIDDEGIREEVDTFMFEGHDTTSVGISLALMLLANNREHQEKIAQELEELFGDSDRPATYEDLQKMPYLELCLKECLRMFPSVPLIARFIEEELKLSTHIVPANTTVNLHIYDLHHDPKYFPDPHKFDPYRFLPENSVGRHPFAYIPFSAGPRNCIGQKFAMLEMKSIVSAILRNYTLEPVDTPESMKLKLDFVLRNDDDIIVKFRPRKI